MVARRRAVGKAQVVSADPQLQIVRQRGLSRASPPKATDSRSARYLRAWEMVGRCSGGRQRGLEELQAVATLRGEGESLAGWHGQGVAGRQVIHGARP